jgi:hypothetical protein
MEFTKQNQTVETGLFGKIKKTPIFFGSKWFATEIEVNGKSNSSEIEKSMDEFKASGYAYLVAKGSSPFLLLERMKQTNVTFSRGVERIKIMKNKLGYYTVQFSLNGQSNLYRFYCEDTLKKWCLEANEMDKGCLGFALDDL